VRGALPGATADRILQLWDARDRLCAVLDQLPQTFCHLDLNPRNLFVRPLGNGEIESVAIDWEFAGVSALGAELATLVGGSLVFDLADLEGARELEAGVFTSYLAGLQETGWSGNQRHVWLGYTIAMGLHIIFVMVWVLEAGANDEGFRQWGEQLFRRPYAEILARNARLLEFFLARTDEAQQTLRSA
jgi:thiamine kinase-like enzyme